jgi:hypothetical protein
VRDLTVRELLAMIGSLYPAALDLDELLALTSVTEFADQRTHKLSGGQTQRVRFALALVSDPDLLVLDEPTVAMHVKSRQVFWSSMRARWPVSIVGSAWRLRIGPSRQRFHFVALRGRLRLRPLRWQDRRVLVIGHVATRWALDHHFGGVPLETLASEEFAW